MLPFYTYFLSTSEYGTVDLFQTIVSLLIPIVYLQLEQAVFRFLIDFRDDSNEKNKVISTAFFTITFLSIVYLIIFLIVSAFINVNYKYFIFFNVVVTMFSSLHLQICRGLGDNISYSIGSLISGITTVLLNVLFIAYFNMGIAGMLFAILLANLLCFSFLFIRKQIFCCLNRKSFSFDLLKKMLTYSIPLIPNQLSWWVVNVSDRTIITFFLGIAVNGIYSAVNKFSAIIINVFNVFNITWTESAAVHLKDDDSSVFFTNIFNSTLKIFSSLCFLVIVFMPFAFNFVITGSGYSDGYFQVPILLVATFFNIVVSVIGSMYIALKKTSDIAKTTFVAALINIVINLLLINKIGLYAASLSTLFAYLLIAVYRYIDIQKYIKLSLDKKYAIITCIFCCIIVLAYYLDFLVLNILSVILTLLYSYYFCKGYFKSLVSIIKSKLPRK